MAHVFQPESKSLISRGFESIADVPVLFDNGHSYCREHNRFLRERTLGEWRPGSEKSSGSVYSRSVWYPRPQTIKNIAYELKNFIEWCAFRQIDWRIANYQRHIRSYCDDTGRGAWSADGRPLDASTIEQRASTATHFLTWAAERGLRAGLVVPNDTCRRPVKSGKTSKKSFASVSGRAGRRRANPMSLRLPSLGELKTWLTTVQARHGHSKMLACRFGVGSACRIDEIASFWASDLPPRNSWNVIGMQVSIRIPRGTKGGKARDIYIPLPLATELDDYKSGRRLSALARFKKAHRSLPPPKEMFLSDYSGKALSIRTLQHAWKAGAPYKEWSPHCGRHTWACYTLLHHLQMEAAKYKNIQSVPDHVFFEVGRSIITTVIKPQLGHCSETTTAMYLRWAMQVVRDAEYPSWHHFLNNSGEN